MIAQGIPCLGPVTHEGCGAICPSYNRGCYACFGPKESFNTSSLSRWWSEKLSVSNQDIVLAFRSFNAYADEFRKESEANES